MSAVTGFKLLVKKMLKKMHLAGREHYLLEHTDANRSVNTTMNRLLDLQPRVTHPAEYIALATLASITQKNIMEVGAYLGYSSCIMASALSENRKVFAIDMFDREKGWKKNTSDDWIFKNYSQWEWAHKNAADLGFAEKIEFIKDTTAGYFKKLSATPVEYDLLFIDGDHSYEGCMADMQDYASLLMPGGYMVMHDYISPKYPGVKKATDEFIQQHPEFESLYLVQSMLIVRKKVRSQR